MCASHKCAVVLLKLSGLCLIEHWLVIFSLLAGLHCPRGVWTLILSNSKSLCDLGPLSQCLNRVGYF